MPGIARDNDTAEGDLIPSQSSVFANGFGIVRFGDSVVSHAPCPVVPSHCNATMATGSPNVFVQGVAVVRAGDPATCAHTATGSPDVFVND